MKNTNLDELLNPLSDVSATGVDLRDDANLIALYYQIKDLRQQARQAEKQYQAGESQDTGLPHWQQLIELAYDILLTKSKDLDIVAWLIEGLLRVEHYAGLAKGFELAAKLIEAYWEFLFPNDIETKLSIFNGLNGQDAPGSLIFPIKAMPITDQELCQTFAVWHYQYAVELDKLSDKAKKAQRIKEIGFALEDIKTAVKATPMKFYENLLNDLITCQEKLNKFDQALLNHGAEHLSSSSYIRHAIAEVQETVQFLLQEKPSLIEINTSQVSSEIAEPDIKPNPIDGRANALAMLKSVANYFSETEPHSPIPFLLERAIRWGNLSLAELLPELIIEESARKHVSQLTGINF